mgnify:CR=1 FL=1
MMTNEMNELIRALAIEVTIHKGEEALYIPGHKKPTKAQLDRVRALKPQIIAELKRRETEKAAQEKAEKEQRIADIKAGKLTIKAHYHDGEYLSGYTVFGEEASLLEEIGIAKHVSGWGTCVDDKAIEALGKEFTYPEALEYVRPTLEAKEAKKAAAEAERAGKLEEAKRTGKPVEIRSWTAECNDPHEQCSLDIITEYAMPDGTIRTDREHTW